VTRLIALVGLASLVAACNDFADFDREHRRDAARPRIVIDPETNPPPLSSPDGGVKPHDSGVPPTADSGALKPDSGPPADSCGHNASELQVFTLLNAERAKSGLSALKCDAAAVKAARGYSQQMCDQGFFDHIGPDGSTPASRLKAAGAVFSAAGENIAWGYPTAQDVHDGWMGSSGHRANMLSTSWDRVGVGYVLCKGSKAYWTENFLR
jgi:uncharacterized protein YkwD